MMDAGILKRISKYCAGAEKSTHDVITKLTEWGVGEDEIENILRKLRSEKFIDDTRYAKTYVSEKWDLDRWGKIKILNSLRQKNIDENVIEAAMKQIDENTYLEELHELLRKKYKDVKSGDAVVDAKRVMMFAMSRGFEEELISDWIENEISGMTNNE